MVNKALKTDLCVSSSLSYDKTSFLRTQYQNANGDFWVVKIRKNITTQEENDSNESTNRHTVAGFVGIKQHRVTSMIAAVEDHAGVLRNNNNTNIDNQHMFYNNDGTTSLSPVVFTIHRLAVHEQHRNHGIGSMLLFTVEDFVRATLLEFISTSSNKNLRNITATIQATTPYDEQNEAFMQGTHLFYTKHGYTSVPSPPAATVTSSDSNGTTNVEQQPKNKTTNPNKKRALSIMTYTKNIYR